MTSFFEFHLEGESMSAQLVTQQHNEIYKYYVFLCEPKLLKRYKPTYIFTKSSSNKVLPAAPHPEDASGLINAIIHKLEMKGM